MSSEDIAFLRDQVQRLNAVLEEYQKVYKLPQGHSRTVSQKAVWNLERSVLSPLVLEYDEMNKILQEENNKHRSLLRDLQLKLERVIAENERLTSELRTVLESRLDPRMIPDDQVMPHSNEEEIFTNLQQQLDFALREKEMSDERWRAAAIEIDQLEKELQAEKDSHRWNVVQRQAEEVQVQFTQTAAALTAENDGLRQELRDAKTELSRTHAEIMDLRNRAEDLEHQMKWKSQEQMSRDVKDGYQSQQLREMAQGMEELRNRLNALSRENELLKEEKQSMTVLLSELKNQRAAPVDKEFDLILKTSEVNQIAESAMLEKDQVEFRYKQKEKEVEQLQEAINRLIHEAGVRTRTEVDKVRLLGNSRISRLAEELQSSEMLQVEKQAQIDRLLREKRLVEAELEKISKDGLHSKNQEIIEDLNRRAIDAERARNEVELKLQTLQSKIRKEEMNNEQLRETLESQVRSLREKILTLETDFSTADSDRLQYLGENEELKKKLQAVEKEKDTVQRKYMKEVALVEEDLQTKLRCYEVRLQVQEDAYRNSLMELRKLLNAQQRMSSRWKEECEILTAKFEKTIRELREELSSVKRRNEELQSLLNESQVKMAMTEKTMTEYTRHMRRMEEKVRNSDEKMLEATQALTGCSMRERRLVAEKESLLQEFARSQRNSLSQSVMSADPGRSLKASDLISNPLAEALSSSLHGSRAEVPLVSQR